MISTFSLSIAQQQHVLEIGELMAKERVSSSENREKKQGTLLYTPPDTSLFVDPTTPFFARTYTSPQSSKVTIEYDIASKQYVKVDVFEVNKTYSKTLVNAHQEAGNYKVYFEGAERNSGLYICRITVNGNVWVEPMLLVK